VSSSSPPLVDCAALVDAFPSFTARGEGSFVSVPEVSKLLTSIANGSTSGLGLLPSILSVSNANGCINWLSPLRGDKEGQDMWYQLSSSRGGDSIP